MNTLIRADFDFKREKDKIKQCNPGGPVARTLNSTAEGPGSIPDQGTKIP